MGNSILFFGVPGPKKIKRKWRELKLGYFKRHNPKMYADLLYEQVFGYKIDWEHPRDINEWINFLAFETDTSEWSRLADKYLVREYVSSKGLKRILIPLYGVWGSAEDIDFNTLPNSFVIKTNHACGDSIIVHDKASEDLEKVRNKLRIAMATTFGVETAEPHYLRIKPLILAEKLLPPPTNIDYKVWCFYGIPNCIMTISNRDIKAGTYNLCVYDLNWEKHNEWLAPHDRCDVEIPRPEKLEEMLEYARILSEGFPQVRIDFYHTYDGVFFGEMTFTSLCGRMQYFTKEYLVTMGNEVALRYFGQ